jgi:hypothetical protein
LNSGCPKTNQATRNAWLNTDLIALTGYAGYLRFTLRVNETAFSTTIELSSASLRNWNGGILEQWVLGRWYVGLLAKFILPWGQELINIYFPFKTNFPLFHV